MRKRSFKKNYLRIRNKKNRTWSDTDKLKIYTLRKEGLTAQEVARKFKTTIIHVYNITRLTKKALKEECYICGHKLTKKERAQKGLIKICSKCRAFTSRYKSKRRKEALKRGLCGTCGINPVIPGYTSCEKCISSTYRRRIRKGLCGQCGKNPISEKSKCFCLMCLTKKRTKKWKRVHA